MTAETTVGGEFAGRTYVVAGGTGVAGESVVRALIERGATVAVPSRSPERLAALRDAVDSDRLHGFAGDLSDLGAAAQLCRRIIATVGPLDGVIAALGGWWEGIKLVELDLATWRRLLDDNLTSHFVIARTFLPVLADRTDAVYVTLGGIASVKAEPGSGPISVTGAGQAMMMRVLAAELADRPVRLHEVDIFTPVVTERWDNGPIAPDWLTGREVGDYLATVLRPGFSAAGSLFLSLPDDRPRTEFAQPPGPA